MFLDMMSRRNPGLIQAGVQLHQEGVIPPNTYLIDVDAVLENTTKLAAAAREAQLTLYFISKQFGRVPPLCQWISQQGIPQAVAVDMDEARILHRAGVQLGHVGHLVQPGKNEWNEVLSLKPEVVTLFSLERARQLSRQAEKMGLRQPVLLRVIKKGDEIYPGQQGGFSLQELPGMIPELLRLGGIKIAGVTSFPVLQMDPGRDQYQFTANLETLKAARLILEDAGVKVEQINGPGGTCCLTIPELKAAGVTHGEPGHALTGTTPLHAVREDLPEMPAIIYVTEVSHQDDAHTYVIGGGFYGRSRMTGAFVGSKSSDILSRKVPASPLAAEYIDYYGALSAIEQIHPGDTAIFSFRTQIFVTRSHVALVCGIRQGKPEVVHFYWRG